MASRDEIPWAASSPSSSRRGVRVCVLGGACIGLSTAVVLAKRLRALKLDDRVSVTVVSDSFPPHTTSNVAAGLVRPFSVSGTRPELLERWTLATQKWLEKQIEQPTGPQHGIFPNFIVEGSDNPEHPPAWARQNRAFQMLGAEDQAELGTPKAWMYKCIIVQSGAYLLWLKELCVEHGVALRKQVVNCVDDVDDYDVVVNCTGLRSRQLFHDASLVAVRGQVLRVHAPWVKSTVMVNKEDAFTYVIPNRDYLVLGGTVQVGNWSTAVDPADTESILERCCAIVPSLRSATVMEAVVGLRPYRAAGVRIELERVALRSGRAMPVVHHYGHGGAGYTLHWGCAQDAVDLVVPTLEGLVDTARPVSKL